MSGSAERNPGLRGGHTGAAIVVAIVVSIIFYTLYRLLFSFVVGTYASYDPAFANGIGSLVLIAFGSSVLALVAGVAAARKLFPRADATGLFYGVATFVTLDGILTVFRELGRIDGNWIFVAIDILVAAVSVFAIWALLADA